MSHWPGKYVIGLTGNIATGKSIVRQMLHHSGAYTIDADGLAHQVMMPNAPAYKPIIDTFGQFIVGEDGRINRALLGSIVFSNQTALKKLEEITHPIIRQAIDVLVKRSKHKVIVIEAIKLLEGDLAKMVDAVWVVNASRETQYKRLVGKRKMPAEEAKKRILAQNNQADKLKQADVVIQNDGDVEQTWKQVQRHWATIRKQLQESSATPESAPAAPKPAAQPAAAPGALSVKRGSPGNAEQIAAFKNEYGGGDNVTRMDVMLSFGEKSYLVVQDGSENLVGLLGWTVEDLVTRMDEFFLKSGVPVTETVHQVVVAVEEASKELQSEVGFIFLPPNTPEDVLKAWSADNYQPTTLKEIKIPAWREAVEQELKDKPDGTTVLWKQLRKDRVLQPI